MRPLRRLNASEQVKEGGLARAVRTNDRLDAASGSTEKLMSLTAASPPKTLMSPSALSNASNQNPPSRLKGLVKGLRLYLKKSEIPRVSPEGIMIITRISEAPKITSMLAPNSLRSQLPG